MPDLSSLTAVRQSQQSQKSQQSEQSRQSQQCQKSRQFLPSTVDRSLDEPIATVLGRRL